MQHLLELEEQGWQALSSDGESGKRFYSSVLRDDAVMLFPGGMLIEGKGNILESLAAVPWKSFLIEEPRVIPLSESAGSSGLQGHRATRGRGAVHGSYQQHLCASGWQLEAGGSSADTRLMVPSNQIRLVGRASMQ
ncbi:hypothetical protein BH23GEM4_BH23GEM4_06760 [soil metagenome]